MDNLWRGDTINSKRDAIAWDSICNPEVAGGWNLKDFQINLLSLNSSGSDRHTGIMLETKMFSLCLFLNLLLGL